MRSNRLQLNSSKIEVLCCASSRRQHQISPTPVRVCANFIQPASSVCDLGIFLDADASMSKHISRSVSNCFAVLCQIWSIRRSLPTPVLQSLVVLLVIPRLDYNNVTLARLPDNQLSRLQSVLNYPARFLSEKVRGRQSAAPRPTLYIGYECHSGSSSSWQCSVLTYHCLHLTAPLYLADELHRVADIDT